jgi:hypothetical protein
MLRTEQNCQTATFIKRKFRFSPDADPDRLIEERRIEQEAEGELVPRTHGQTDDAITGRAINAEPWEPLPGMVKRQCPECRYFFAVDPDSLEARCPGRRS